MAPHEPEMLADLRAAKEELVQTQATLRQSTSSLASLVTASASSLLAARDPSATQSALTSARQQTAASLSRLADTLNQLAQVSLSVAAVIQTQLVQEIQQLEQQPIVATSSDGGLPTHGAELLLQFKGVRDGMIQLNEKMSNLITAAASRHAALTSAMRSPADTSTGTTLSPAAASTSATLSPPASESTATLSPPASETTATLSPPAEVYPPHQQQRNVSDGKPQQRSEQ